MSKSYFTTFIEQLVEKSPLSKQAIAKKAGVSRPTLYNLLNGDIQEAKISTLVNLSIALDTHPMELLRRYFANSDDYMGDIENNAFPVFAKRKRSKKQQSTGFVADVTYPDNIFVIPGQLIVKTWRVTNTGDFAWENMFFSCVDYLTWSHVSVAVGLKPVLAQVPIPFTASGDSVDITVELIAPELPGAVISYWKTTDAEGKLVFDDRLPLHCLVNVIEI